MKYKFYSILLIFFILIIFITIVTYSNKTKIINSNVFIKIKHLIPDKIKNKVQQIKLFNYVLVKIMTAKAKNSFNNKKISEVRDLLINEYILSPEQITYFEKPDLIESINSKKCKKSQDKPFEFYFCKSSKFDAYPDKNRKIIGIKYYDINNYSIIENPNDDLNDRKKLLIYLAGHNGNPYNRLTKKKGYTRDNFLNIKEHYLKKGFSIMSLTMSNLGYNYNQDSVNFPLIDLSKKEEDIHEMYINFYDENFPKKKPLSLMLSGNYYLIKKIISESSYDEIYMVGMSGGGWYSTFLAAIIPEIKVSFSFSGTMPLFLHFSERVKGDFEQSKSKIFEKVSYWDLYFLATLDNFYKASRKHTQVYNRYERSFGDPYATIMKDVSDNIKNTYFKVEALNNNKHNIDTNFLYSQF